MRQLLQLRTESDTEWCEDERSRCKSFKFIGLAVTMFALMVGAVVNIQSSGRKESQTETYGYEPKRVFSQPGTTAYCFSFMLPDGNEPWLLKNQLHRNASIFGCDAFHVFSTEVIDLGKNVSTHVILPGPNGETNARVNFNTWTWPSDALALNTQVFIRVWRTVFQLGVYKDYDWVVKVDPDCVFFPDRLRDLMAIRNPYPKPEESSWEDCGNCSQIGRENDKCATHVKYVQHAWDQSCAFALERIARPPPLDCGCNCTAKACDRPRKVYFKNCPHNRDYPGAPFRPGLHGPLTVLSKEAAETMQAGGIDRKSVV